jgi:hypothetical protein
MSALAISSGAAFRATGSGETRPNRCRVPTMQKGASLNLEAVKEQIEKSIAARSGN